jgi:cytochrome c oxidase assembly factor CtaG
MSAHWNIALAAIGAAYFLAWRRAAPGPGFAARAWAFATGLAALWAAVASPIAHLDRGHLTGHMIQHLLLMTVAAPLLLWGEPLRVFQRAFRPAAPAPRWPSPHPAACWFAGTFIVLFWHVPALFALGMRWHAFQHATFLVAGLLFWVPVVRPWPMVARRPTWSIPLYLFLATFPCDGLSAFLVFCGRVLYRQYGGLHDECAMTGGVSALEDQQRAGALMWFWVTFAYLLPAAEATIDILSAPQAQPQAFAKSSASDRASAR